MTEKMVECIANYSEARRPEVVEQIAAAIRSAPGVTILDRHSDHDHNRTVITFVGPPAAVEEAAFQSIKKAGELINLDQHTGEHPRVGAADVVPFVPISGVTMQACVEMAQRVGRRVGEELGVPVYLYEEAATRPERVNLENVRRGQYEALKEEMGVKPERAPDFGPEKIGPAGATVIGARQPLVAYNVYLTTADESIANKIARAVRHSSGGLRFVKGLGMHVEGRAQVSMNLTNFRKTPIARVQELIRREAERYGVGIHHAELVGLIPQEALVDAAQWYLQLDQFERTQILEQRLAAARAEEAQAPDNPQNAGDAGFLEALAAGEPAPGGGSAAAYSGAMGAALAAMAARLTLGKKKYAAVQAEMQTVIDRADVLRREMLAAVEKDAAAFMAVMEAYRLPKDTPEDAAARAQAIEARTLAAAQAPLQAAEWALEVMQLAALVVEKGNVNAISDAAVGVNQAHAALIGSGYNVRINIAALQDSSAGQPLLDRLAALERQAAQLADQTRALLTERGGFSF